MSQTNARTSSYSRRVPIRRWRFASSLPIDRSLSPDLLGRAVVRESAFLGFLCSRALSRRTAPQLPEITSLSPARPFFSPALSSSFFPSSSLPSSHARRVPHADLLPLSARYISFFLPSLSAPVLFLSSPSRQPRFAALAACRKPPYLPLLSSLSLFRARVARVRHIKPLGDIFSRRPWRKKKPNISWRQIVIGACTTGTVPLSADRSFAAGEKRRGTTGMTVAVGEGVSRRPLGSSSPMTFR